MSAEIQPSINYINKYIDHVFYINMDKRTDRKELIETELDAYDISYERFKAIEHPFGAVGCSLSHLAILKIAKERKYKSIMILEDDFQFVVPKEELHESIRKLYEDKVNFDVCMLAYNECVPGKTSKYTYLKKVVHCRTTSGYIIRQQYYDKIIQLFELTTPMLEKTKNKPLYACDMAWIPFQTIDKWYRFAKRIGKQRNGFSDIEGRTVFYDC
jgi:glycosyl transferase family 25